MPPLRSGMPSATPVTITISALDPAIAALTNARPTDTGRSDEGVAKM